MFPGLSWQELIIVGVIAILLFGKRLPEVAKSLGNSYRQFRRGLNEFHSAVDLTDTSPAPTYRSTSSTTPSNYADDYDEPSAPRFEPPPAEPTPPASSSSNESSGSK